MKIITWNCNGALRKKLPEVDALNADVLVIQECEDPQFFGEQYLDWAGEYLWLGSNKNRGIGIFPKNGNRVAQLNWLGTYTLKGLSSSHASTTWSTSDLRMFLPFTVNDHLTVLAVWTKGSDNEVFGYVGQLWKYLQIHREELSRPSTMILGDLNSNAIWDKADRWWSHSGVVAELAEIGLQSLYHRVTNETQGSESIPTFYLQRNLSKPYHIDYAFLSADLMEGSNIEVGRSSDWLSVSDHMPLILDISQ
ncbi:MAG: endonuclease/exonuclease/phosphatase family protein [Pseudohongiella sp.]|nr:endonuclease/exonuclease/phosphatase family protein [Pseudohongiella sp.]